MSLKQQATKGVVWSVAQKWGTQLISFCVFLVLSRLLEPEAFGLVALASVFIVLVEIFLDQGFSEAIVQRTELEHEHLDTAFWTGILTSLLLMGFGIAASGLVAQLFKEPQLAPVVAGLSLSFPIGALSSTQQAILQRKLAFKSLTLRSLASAAVGGIVGVVMAFQGFGVWSLVVQTLVNNFAGAVVLWRVSDWRPGFNFAPQHFKELFHFGFNVVGIKLLDFVNRRSDDFLIGYFLGAKALGYYTIAYRLLFIIIKLLTGVTTSVAYPTFSRMQHDPEKMRRAFYQVTQYTSLISFPAFLVMMAMAPELTLLLFGAKWSPSIPVMQVLSIIGVVLSVSYFNNTVIKASGRPDWLLKIMLVNSVCNALGFLFAVRWGIVAVASAYVTVSYLLFPVYLRAVYRSIRIDLKTYFGQFVMPLGASLIAVAAIYGMKTISGELSLWVQVILYGMTAIVLYTAIILLFARSLFDRVLELIHLVRKKT